MVLLPNITPARSYAYDFFFLRDYFGLSFDALHHRLMLAIPLALGIVIMLVLILVSSVNEQFIAAMTEDIWTLYFSLRFKYDQTTWGTFCE
jgi:hypothetical protein